MINQPNNTFGLIALLLFIHALLTGYIIFKWQFVANQFEQIVTEITYDDDQGFSRMVRENWKNCGSESPYAYECSNVIGYSECYPNSGGGAPSRRMLGTGG